MKVVNEFIGNIEKEREIVFYKFPKTGKKFKFVLKPLMAKDFFKDDIMEKAKKEMATGQSQEEASRVLAENIKKEFQDMSVNSMFKILVEKSVVFPKITDKTEDLADDELPFSYLDIDMKNFIVKNIQRISPIFRG